MRLILFTFLAVILAGAAAQAQSVMDNLPPVIVEGTPAAEAPKPATPAPAAAASDPYTVADVNADVTADTAAHARDQALLQAQRTAYVQLCARLGVPDNSIKLTDDALAALVQSFEVQSERLSAVRYIGVFTIRFKPSAVQKKAGTAVVAVAAGDSKPAVQGPTAHMTVAVQSDSLAAWSQIKRRLGAVPQVAGIEVLDLGRGLSHIDLSYGGSPDDLKQAVAVQGLVLRQNGIGIWELYDGSMVAR
jgi:hypothetical protein